MAEIQRFLSSEPHSGGPAAVGFCQQGQVYRVCALDRLHAPPRSDAAIRFWSRGFVVIRPTQGVHSASPLTWSVTVDLGLRRFFIPNRIRLPGPENEHGWELELSHRPGLEPLPRRLFFRDRPIELR